MPRKGGIHNHEEMFASEKERFHGVCGERKTSTKRGREGEEQLVCCLSVKSEDYGRARAGGTEMEDFEASSRIQAGREKGGPKLWAV